MHVFKSQGQNIQSHGGGGGGGGGEGLARLGKPSDPILVQDPAPYTGFHSL